MNNTAFKPAWWLRNAHMQTLWPKFCRKQPAINTRQERIELPDGDFLDLNFTQNQNGPVVLVLHGLEGCIQSKYARGILKALHDNAYRGVFMHFRSCSSEPNRLPRSYHSGETGDIHYIINLLQQRYPNTPKAAIGFSLGGNALLKLLGENRQGIIPLDTAIAISVPFQLDNSAHRLNRGFSKLYRSYLIRSLRNKIEQKRHLLNLSLASTSNIRKIRDFWTFDDTITAPLHGFKNVHDYYARSSCRQYLKNIHIPTLILHAKDDPFMTQDAIPKPHELSRYLTLEVSDHGGHVGFITGNVPWKCQYWLEQRVISFLNQTLKKTL